jgi:hypothetical protein
MVVGAAFYSWVSRQEIIDVDNQNTGPRGRMAVGATSFAMAQQTGNPAGNAGMSGGPGTHQGHYLQCQSAGDAAEELAE